MIRTQLGTGTLRERQHIYYELARAYQWLSFGRAGSDWIPFTALIESIDAPDVMPAGGLNSTEWVNGAGQPVAHTSETRREG